MNRHRIRESRQLDRGRASASGRNNDNDGTSSSSIQEALSAFWEITYVACNPVSLDGVVAIDSICTDTSNITMADNTIGSPTRRAGPANAVAWAGQWAHTAGQTVQSWTVRRYALPDKHVASQVLMYRQLLHTKCRPGLTLSRDYQATPAQRAVKDMPWWCLGVEETRKMVISYDDLLKRLWVGGSCTPFHEIDHLLTDDQKAPVPHAYWVDRLGFQQTDPVTDFRSGGVLSLAMMVHLVEACPQTHQRFVRPDGDASVLPFGITSINITDMMARFLMLSKAVDRMDALLSQKPFWCMFADPFALLVCQEVSMEITADVVVELRQERGRVTVFDFAEILKIVEDRVERDLLGAGPKSVEELRTLYQRNRIKYQRMLSHRLGKQTNSAPTSGGVPLGTAAAAGDTSTLASTAEKSARSFDAQPTVGPTTGTSSDDGDSGNRKQLRQSVWNQATALRSQATKVADTATSFAGSVFQKIKAPGFTAAPTGAVTMDSPSTTTTEPPDLLSASPPKASTAPVVALDSATDMRESTIVDLPPPNEALTSSSTHQQTNSDDEDWAKVITPVTEEISNFSIGGDDDADEDL